MLTDIEIAQSCEMQPIGKIAEKLNIPEEMLAPYGRYKAKVDHIALKALPQKGRLVRGQPNRTAKLRVPAPAIKNCAASSPICVLVNIMPRPPP